MVFLLLYLNLENLNMDPVKLLIFLIDVFYYGVILVSLIMLSLFMHSWIFEPESALIFSKIDLRNMTLMGFTVVVLSVISIILFITTLYHLRKAILRISKNELYHINTIKHLNFAGWTIIFYAIFKYFLEYIQIYLDNGSFTVISLDFKGFNSLWFIMILGLFFQLISRVFENARKLKLENDLTI